MVQVAVVGGGVSGLAASLALARAGHSVTLFERDPSPAAADPDEAFEADRRGAPQVRHSHAFLGLARTMLRDHHPDVLDALYAAGATELRFADGIPPTITNYVPDPSDDDLTMIACRRTTFEWVLRCRAEAEGGLVVRGGADVVGLTTAAEGDGPPRVTGVRLADGSEHAADITVVGNGRRSALPEWIDALGAGPVEEIVDESGIVYFSRFYRLRPGQTFPPRTGPIGGDLGYIKYGVFPGDNGTFSITLAVPTDDDDLRRLLDDPDRFDACSRSLVFTAPYVDGRAEPITEVHKIASLITRWRDYDHDGVPLVRGAVAIGDALLATNPLYGRGCAIAIWAAQELASSMAAHPDSVDDAQRAYYQGIRDRLRPWFDATLRSDADARRIAAAILAGDDPDGDPDDPARMQRAVLREGLRPAMRSDAVVLRAFMRTFNLLTEPNAVLADQDVMARVFAAYEDRANRPPEPVMGPDRDGMLAALRNA